MMLRWFQLPLFVLEFIIIIIISSSSSSSGSSSTCLKPIEYEDAETYHTALLFQFLTLRNVGKFPQTPKFPCNTEGAPDCLSMV
jgi:hypothetical protein